MDVSLRNGRDHIVRIMERPAMVCQTLARCEYLPDISAPRVGEHDGIRFELVAADAIGFAPRELRV